jgi:hypothetical protein
MPERRSMGPLLEAVFEAQRYDEEATAYPAVAALGTALARVVEELGCPVVWPVGAPAERLVGAATVLSKGRVKTAGWTAPLLYQRILLLAVTSVSPLPLLLAAEQARHLGAMEVHACGVNVEGIDGSEPTLGLDSYRTLEPVHSGEGGAAPRLSGRRRTAYLVARPK